MKIYSVTDCRARAKKRLPAFLFNYIDGGASEEITLERNREDLRSLVLRQRVLKDVSGIDLSTTLFGQQLAAPIILGPVGMAGMTACRGEVQAARAAAAAGVPFCLSTVSTCSLEEVAKGVETPPWFQLYITRDRAVMEALLDRAMEEKCPALMVTVDMPVSGIRYRDYRSGLSGVPGLQGHGRRILQALGKPAWSLDVGLLGRPHAFGNIAPFMDGKAGMEDFFGWVGGNFDPTIVWKDIEYIRQRWSGPLVLKGILDPEDAAIAAGIGVDGIIVSNHGGRQLDGAASAVSALPAVVDAVGDRLPVLVDGGLRSGSDVLKMLALGARGVLLGRAWAWALAAEGETGISGMLELIKAEMRTAMALTGVTGVEQISSDLLVSS
ncbi:L-lactate dehydrogenase [Emcibacter sp.]|uniref:L-lactate dehydrogenase n=1 Tax=Emcibacter sp. TaxID=1979954 RepID=UPI003A8D342B